MQQSYFFSCLYKINTDKKGLQNATAQTLTVKRAESCQRKPPKSQASSDRLNPVEKKNKKASLSENPPSSRNPPPTHAEAEILMRESERVRESYFCSPPVVILLIARVTCPTKTSSYDIRKTDDLPLVGVMGESLN